MPVLSLISDPDPARDVPPSPLLDAEADSMTDKGHLASKP